VFITVSRPLAILLDRTRRVLPGTQVITHGTGIMTNISLKC